MIRAVASKASRIIVPECNAGKICNEVQRVVRQDVESMPKLGGAMHIPSEILDAIKRS
jgi:pyruvate/2-oxoacid:ferredoxin oxidoreductase alpha subunit